VELVVIGIQGEKMAEQRQLFEGDDKDETPDPDATPIRDRKLIALPYDLVITALLDQIGAKTLHLRPISDRPSFQRRYVWADKLASRLIESILLNVPIPPCYLSQNKEFELDVIDGQQRIYSIYRFKQNQLKLSGLEVLIELNGVRFFELPKNLQRKLETYTLRCIVISNDSDPEIMFDVFERLNTNTIPLNAQEIRNCIHRGSLIDLVNKLANNSLWLETLNRKEPDKRMKGEELILRFFAFHLNGVDSYKTPQKHWLNDAAEAGRKFSQEKIDALENTWMGALEKSLIVFKPNECFRRLPLERSKSVINLALMDLTMTSLAKMSKKQVEIISKNYYERYIEILKNEEFSDLITRAVDHKTRTLRRFKLWNEKIINNL
jgi:hypothetical protein